MCLLLRVVLDDELLLDRDVDLRSDRDGVHEDPHAVRQRLEPRRDVALAVGARGVQLGFRSPPLKAIRPHVPGWVGVSCHSAGDLVRAAEGGADFAVLSPVFGVPDKGRPLGLSVFQRLVDEAPLPVVALGGIDAANAAEVRGTGAVGLAVIRALRDADDPGRLARKLVGPVTRR